jgi:hypothetical protein
MAVIRAVKRKVESRKRFFERTGSRSYVVVEELEKVLSRVASGASMVSGAMDLSGFVHPSPPARG